MSDFLHLVWKLIDGVGQIDDDPALEAAAALRPMLETLEQESRFECAEYAIAILKPTNLLAVFSPLLAGFNGAEIGGMVDVYRQMQLQPAAPIVVTEEMIDAAMTPAGGWTRDQLREWGVPWPPPKGWRKKLLKGDPQ